MSGPLSDASARLTVSTRLLKSLNSMLILTFGYFAMNCLVSSWMTGIRPGSWLSYDHTFSSPGPSDSKPSIWTVGSAAAVAPAGAAVVSDAAGAAVVASLSDPGVPPHAATTTATSSASSAAMVPLLI